MKAKAVPNPATLKDLADVVDRCAALRARIDELNDEKKDLEAALCATGLDRVEGTMHVASISHGVRRAVTDWKAVAEKLKPSWQLVTAHTRTSGPFDTVRYSARKIP